MTWTLYEASVADPHRHVAPNGDLKDHVLDGFTCWCQPKDDDGLVVHNAMDRREEFEPDYKFGEVRKAS